MPHRGRPNAPYLIPLTRHIKYMNARNDSRATDADTEADAEGAPGPIQG